MTKKHFIKLAEALREARYDSMERYTAYGTEAQVHAVASACRISAEFVAGRLSVLFPLFDHAKFVTEATRDIAPHCRRCAVPVARLGVLKCEDCDVSAT